MQRISAVLAFAAFLVAAPAAQASSVSFVVDRYVGGFFVTADPGEANDVLVDYGDGSETLVRDSGAALEVRGECRRIDASTALCPGGRAPQVILGDGDDRIAVQGQAQGTSIFGGPGDDIIAGGSGNDGIRGGEGRDRLAGGSGNDYLEGGGDRDRLDGGAGHDAIAFSGRTVPAIVDLMAPAGVGGAPGEDDAIRGVESVSGASGPDVLSGDDGPNVLDGVLGDDTLRGRGGDDRLRGSGDLKAGPGDDLVEATGGDVDCGPGDDWVEPLSTRIGSPSPPPRLARDCESVLVDPRYRGARLRLPRRPGGPFVLVCPRTHRCRGSLDTERFVVRAGRRKVLQSPRRRAGLHRLVIHRPRAYDAEAAFRLR